MIRYGIDKILEGSINDEQYIRIIPSGWINMHYFIREYKNVGKSDVILMDHDQVEICLKDLHDSGNLKDVDMAHYLAASIEDDKPNRPHIN